MGIVLKVTELLVPTLTESETVCRQVVLLMLPEQTATFDGPVHSRVSKTGICSRVIELTASSQVRSGAVIGPRDGAREGRGAAG